MVINLDPFHHNNYNDVMIPQRADNDNADESPNDSKESVNDDLFKLAIKEEDGNVSSSSIFFTKINSVVDIPFFKKIPISNTK